LDETRLLLIRHAETSAPDFFHGAESDIGLSERGHRQAVLLGEALKARGISAVYCSGMRRAIDTATTAGNICGLIPSVIRALHERKIGPLSGLSREEGWSTYQESKQRWIAGDLDFTHPGGESFAAIGQRVVPVIVDLVRDHPGQTIAVVAHGIVIRVLLLSLLPGLQPADFDRIAIDFASINDLGWDGVRWIAHTLNQVVAPSPAKPVA
jgi:broad specificity phosphatase PhoE